MYFSSNIKYLRKRKKRTQDEVAFALKMKRSTLSGYENRVSQPSIEVLLAFSDYYKIAIDTLIKVDLGKLPESQLRQLERGYDVFIRGTKIRVLATTVNPENVDNIELVNEKAKAGYSSGYADPEYIKVLPTFYLPFLSKDKKYRTFQISGDSMLPIPDGAYVTGEYVENWEYIRDGKAYIILTVNDGIVFKNVENRIAGSGQLRLHSLNPLYEAYDLDIQEVREVWRFVNYISPEIPKQAVSKQELKQEITELKQRIESIQLKLDL